MKSRFGVGPTMPKQFEPLATYNAECARGIVHTDWWREKMAALQVEFNEWAEAVREERGNA